jgi:hypothetical protein
MHIVVMLAWDRDDWRFVQGRLWHHAVQPHTTKNADQTLTRTVTVGFATLFDAMLSLVAVTTAGTV